MLKPINKNKKKALIIVVFFLRIMKSNEKKKRGNQLYDCIILSIIKTNLIYRVIPYIM